MASRHQVFGDQLLLEHIDLLLEHIDLLLEHIDGDVFRVFNSLRKRGARASTIFGIA